ncbi:hypothetical protein [Clostridium manihotivorum]|uniref:Uncharacterized protein n=1 Tax=Clostridium manihotivorum TaxID=2320868 RepID=A0A410DY96_9CLOT|nr:hypothetical protein [Clostridium manihotivorum]QAA34041.1 hypothetical protein C1I91_21790 [Clostridium manihotivorum]
MYCSRLEKRINRRKFLLNLCLNFLSPTNFFVLKLSENWDKLVVKQQKSLLKKHMIKNNFFEK